MRLTPEFMSKTQSHLNPSKERESESRGLAIPVIENSGSHQGTYDTSNSTDNSITVLGNIPQSNRSQAIHAAENQISSISPSLPNNLPNLVTLTSTDNAISSSSTLSPSADLPFSRYLSLRGNPVTQHEHYKDFTVWKVAGGKSHVSDFERIKDADRTRARQLSTNEDGQPNELATKLSIPTTSGIPGATMAKAAKQGGKAGLKGRLMTPEEKRRVVEALTRANTAEEVRKLERMLADGLIPEGGDAVIEASA